KALFRSHIVAPTEFVLCHCEFDQACAPTRWPRECRFQFHKRHQLFICANDETLPSPRCGSAVQIFRPSKSRAETQPELQPAFLRLSAVVSPRWGFSAPT